VAAQPPAMSTDVTTVRRAFAPARSLPASRRALLGLAAAFGAAALAGYSLPRDAQLVAYLVGMVGLNLPHGGYEHYVNLRHRGLPFGAGYVGRYLAMVGGLVGLFFLAPAAGTAVAFSVAMAKGGGADAAVLDGPTGATYLDGRGRRLLAALARGTPIILVPLAVQPGEVIAFATYVTNVFEPGALTPWLADVWRLRVAAGGVVAGSVLGHLAAGYRADGGAAWRVDAAETLLLVAYFAVVPVIVAIGLYFPLWYSLRQAGRSEAVRRRVDPAGDGPTRRQAAAIAAGGVAVTLALGVGLFAVAPNPLSAPTLLVSAVAFYTLFVCVIALPHVVVGALLDPDRGIWYVP